jgi:hypothetical protein
MEITWRSSQGTCTQGGAGQRKMSATPFMPLWVADFVGDTLDLDAKEIGAYMLILMSMWGRDGYLPNDTKKLQRVARCGRDWPRVWAAIEHYFTVEGDQITAIAFEKWQKNARSTEKRPWIPLAVQRFVHERDGENCAYCGTTEGPFHLDHVTPWAIGGDHTPENLTVCCAQCNWSKGSKTLSEWRGF